MRKEFLLFAFAAVLSSCVRDIKYPNVSHINSDIKVIPFYSDLFAITSDSATGEINALKNRYGSYLDLYSSQIIKVGSPNSDDYNFNLMKFVGYEANQEVVAACDSMLDSYRGLKKDLDKAFKYYQYHFPEVPVPDVYLHISGFNQSLFIDSAFVSISVEKYLGAGCRFYKWLDVPMYLRGAMTRERIVPDVMRAMFYAWQPNEDDSEKLLSQMIYQGKVLYGIKSMMPELPDSLLFGFTRRQLKWCEKHESQVWSYVVENKYLFGTNRLDNQKFIGEAPFTSFFGQDSPGKALLYNAYQIVKQYMKQDETLTLHSLFGNGDSQQILSKSRYRP
jgi:hypothetical protein